MAIELLKYGWSKLKHTISVKYTLDFKDLVQNLVKYLMN